MTLQAALDDAKARVERNKLGQFATPQPLARAMLRQAAGRRRDLRERVAPLFDLGGYGRVMRSALSVVFNAPAKSESA